MSRDVEFARLIDATPEVVFDAFTDPEGQQAFYGQDDTGWIVESHCDLRIGGVWTVAFGPSPRELFRHRPTRDEPPVREVEDDHDGPGEQTEDQLRP